MQLCIWIYVFCLPELFTQHLFKVTGTFQQAHLCFSCTVTLFKHLQFLPGYFWIMVLEKKRKNKALGNKQNSSLFRTRFWQLRPKRRSPQNPWVREKTKFHSDLEVMLHQPREFAEGKMFLACEEGASSPAAAPSLRARRRSRAGTCGFDRLTCEAEAR